MDIKFDDKLPIYVQIMNSIKKDIVSESLKPGDKLPSVREMSSKFKVNPNTLQRVYQELERQNITYTQRGTGTFVKEDIAMVSNLKKGMAKEMIDGFINGMKNLGFSKEEIVKIIQDKLQEE
ncbi:GntR family transcriptional regulator [Clostridium sp. P21]|uniref:GntR family transcriptional regulator n=1 Tax=Clostridium muellerianum TaxID=2716538 RepID=A0A7Y0HNJ9_9CLOT|nr:GntR family transcriptional regulator [Clostridium muellerianum]NMM62747.1 GntR family transcriptional regulator [Clostridium muellerianum]